MPRFFDTTNPRKNRKITNFPKEIMIELGGKKQDIRKMIKTNAEGTGIYEQIEMYGLNPIQPVEITEFVQDFTEMAGDLRTAIERGQLAKQMFRQLPIEVREEFNNDEDLFMRTGEDWINKKRDEFIKQQQAQQKQGGENVKE